MVIVLDAGKRIRQNTKHILWNYEESPERVEGIRFHGLIVGKRGSQEIGEKLIKKLSKNGIIISPLERIRKTCWEKTGSKMIYTLVSYDTERLLIEGNLLGVRVDGENYQIARYDPLREHQEDGTGIEEFVEAFYGLNHFSKARLSQ